jgi:predicted Mrr-cat superfamily restriction endonuclease
MGRNIWRLVTHHIDPEAALSWYLQEGWIAVGWGNIGNLSQYSSKDQIKSAIREAYPDDTPAERAFGAPSLWGFYHELALRDWVILSTGQGGGRKAVMEVVGAYEYRDTKNVPPFNGNYGHQRKAQLLPGLDADELWKKAEGMAPGQNLHYTLIRCEKPYPEPTAKGK